MDKRQMTIVIVMVIALIGLLIALFSSGSSSSSAPSVQEVTNTPVQAVVSEEATENKPNIEYGQYDTIYLANKDCTYDDGSYIAINVQTTKKYENYQVNNGDSIQNAIVIEIGSTIEGVRKYIDEVGYIAVYDSDGKHMNAGDIYTQTGLSLPEIIFMPDGFEDCKYVVLGGLDNPRKIMFDLE